MDPENILKVLPAEVVEEAYSDGVKSTLQEVSKIGVDALKTVRLILFPLQYGAAIQDRLATYLDRAIRKVPEANRIAPMESLALPIAEKLRFQEETNIITEMYISLLARAMDRERVGEAHPAFIHVVGQLAPDEVLLVEQLSKVDPSCYARKGARDLVPVSEALEVVRNIPVNSDLRRLLSDGLVNRVHLSQPELLFTYIEHLVSLGIVSYTNEPWEQFGWDAETMRAEEHNFWFIRLNEFGQLFHQACIARASAV